ncbi:MAG: right-handed parallel beta-helix repeat-containing protein [Planctomycetota bacterium]
MTLLVHALRVLIGLLAVAPTAAQPLGPIIFRNPDAGSLVERATGRIPVSPTTTPGGPFSTYTLDEAGHYVLVENLLGEPNKNGIIITAPNVTLDLNGYSIIGAADSRSGIIAPGDVEGVHIARGTIRDWPDHGVDLGVDRNHRYTGLFVANCGGDGIRMSADSIATDLVLIGNGGNGLTIERGSGTIERAMAIFNAGNGFDVASEAKANRLYALVNDGAGITGHNRNVITESNAVLNTADGFRLGLFSTLERCLASRNGDDGFDLGNQATLRDCTADDNTVNGITAGWRLTAERVVAWRNGAHGISAESHARIIDSYATVNANSGIVATWRPNITGSFATWNQGHGFELGNDARVASSDASDNTGLGLNAGSSLQLDRFAASFNAGGGVTASDAAHVLDSRVSNNGNTGLLLGPHALVSRCHLASTAGIVVQLDRGSKLTDSTIRHAFDSAGGALIGDDTLVAGNLFRGGLGVHITVTGTRVRIDGNEFFESPAALSLLVDGRALITSNRFGDCPVTIPTGNSFGPLVDLTAGGDLSAIPNADHPQANFID